MLMSYFKNDKLLLRESRQEKENAVDFNILLCINKQRNLFSSESRAMKRWAALEIGSFLGSFLRKDYCKIIIKEYYYISSHKTNGLTKLHRTPLK